MKKKIAKDIIFYFILVVITYVLQTTFFKWFAFNGVSPNLFIVIIVTISLLRGRVHGAIIGLMIGCVCDIFAYGPFGFHTIIYMNVGFFSGYLYNYFYNDSVLIPVILMGFMSFLVNYFEYFFGYVFRGKIDITRYINIIFLPDLLYTVFVGFIVYNIFYWIFTLIGDDNKEVRL